MIVIISIFRSSDKQLLGVARSSVYYQHKEVDEFTLKVMNRIDEIATKRPFYGSRKKGSRSIGNGSDG